MGQDEAVDADHDRHRQFLGEPERLDVQIDRLLVGLGKQLQPSGVAHRHRVGMIVPDIDRRADGAVAERHHDRQAEARGVVDRLRHEQQALRGGRGIGAGARGGSADRDRQRRELAFDIDIFAIDQRAFLHQFAEAFDDVGLRRDRIGADHFGAAQRDGFGHGMRAFDLLEHRTFLRLRFRRLLHQDEFMRLPGGGDIGGADLAGESLARSRVRRCRGERIASAPQRRRAAPRSAPDARHASAQIRLPAR